MLFKFIIHTIIATFLLSIPAIAQKTISLSEFKKQMEENSEKSDSKSNTVKNDEKVNFTKFEQEVFDEINEVRKNPTNYVAYLEAYKKMISGNILSLPNQPRQRMYEGKPAIDAAISHLQRVNDLTFLKPSNLLTKVATNQLNDLKENPKLGHFGKDGSDFKARMAKVGKMGRAASENINYKDRVARQTLLTMIIDDGVKSRLHRKNILNPVYNMIGVACGEASNNQMICVLVFADRFDDIESVKGPIEF